MEEPEWGPNRFFIFFDDPPKGLPNNTPFIRLKSMGWPNRAKIAKSFEKFIYNDLNYRYLFNIRLDPEDERVTSCKNIIEGIANEYFSNIGWYEDGELGLVNFFRNLPSIIKTCDLSHLKTQCDFSKSRAIVVGSGPALEDQIKDIADIYADGGSWIIACDSSLKFLLENGVVPQFVISTERAGQHHLFLNNIDQDVCDKMILVSSPVNTQEALAAWKGPTTFVMRDHYEYAWAGFKNRELSLGVVDVASQALVVCGVLGIKDVALAGINLSFQNGISHACFGEENKDFHKKVQEIELSRPHVDVRVKNYENEDVKTTALWSRFGKNFRLVRDTYELRLVHTTYKGAVIETVPCVPLLTWYSANLHSTKPKPISDFDLKNIHEDEEYRNLILQIGTTIAALENDKTGKLDPQLRIAEFPFRQLAATLMRREFIEFENLRFSWGRTRLEDVKRLNDRFDQFKKTALLELKNLDFTLAYQGTRQAK